jgi:ABC-2 type transport system ATP-binding protein
MKDSVRRHAESGAAIIISSHLLSLVEDLCSSLLILHRGRQLLNAPMTELRRQVAEDGRQETLEDLFFRLTEAPGDGEPQLAP